MPNDRTIGKAITDIEAYVETLVDDPPVQVSGLRTSMDTEPSVLMDEKIKTAVNMSKEGGNQTADAFWKSVIESKTIQEIGPLVDSRQYQQWSIT